MDDIIYRNEDGDNYIIYDHFDNGTVKLGSTLIRQYDGQPSHVLTVTETQLQRNYTKLAWDSKTARWNPC